MAPHTPHDDVYDVAVSPDFARDGMVFVVCRDMFLKSTDGGRTWKNVVRGLNNLSQFFSDKAQRFSLDISRQDKRLLYFASRGDNLYRSVDEGSSWSPVDVVPGVHDISLVAISPHSSDMVFAAGAPRGLYTTSDGGGTWRPVTDIGTAVTSIAHSDERDDVIFAGDDDGTIHASEDAGRTWRTTSLDDVGRIRAIAVSPRFSSDETLLVGTSLGGVLASADAGRSFSAINDGLDDLSISSIVFSPTYASDSTLWISTWMEGIYTSHDGGASWQRSSVGLTTNSQKLEPAFEERPHFGRLRMAGARHASDEQTFFLAGFDGLFHSTDGARTWHELEMLPSTLPVSVGVSPNFATDGSVAVTTYINGAYLSEDRGDTWMPINSGLEERSFMRQAPDRIARLFGIGFSPDYASDATLFCAGWTYFLRSATRGSEWSRTELSAEPLPLQQLVMATSPDYARDQTIFLGNRYGDVYRSTDGGTSFSVVGTVGRSIRAIAISPELSSDGMVFAASKSRRQVFVSSDRGVTWSPAGARFGSVTHLAISPDFGRDGTIFAATERGLFVSKDRGQNWEFVAKATFGDESYIEALGVSPDFANDRTVLVSVSGQGLFKSTDGAATFAPVGKALLDDGQILANIPNPAANPIVFSPSYDLDRTIFGYSPTNVFRSTDAGETWADISPPKTVHDMPFGRAKAHDPNRRVLKQRGPKPSKRSAHRAPTASSNRSLGRRAISAALRTIGLRDHPRARG